ncbi:hypothetical protein [Hoeflea sp.]|uniref:hypothetical protein n=1 Tax=Hoeflea sp. TaxID=1940281 RepID=UPI003B02A78C
MKAFETAIRKALQKIDGTNPKLRERVYQSARDALTNSQAKQGIWGSDAATAQDRRLEDLIAAIEAEHAEPPQPHPQPRPARRAPKRETPDFEAQVPPPQPRPSPKPAPAKRPPKERIRWSEPEPEVGTNLAVESIDPVERPQPKKGKRPPKRRAENQLPDIDMFGEKIDARGRPAKQKKRRRPVFSIILVSSLVIAFLGIGILWAVYSGLFLSAEQRDTSIPNPPAKIEGGDFAGNPSADGAFSGDWIEVFTPDDMSRVSRRGTAKAALVDSNGQQALQVVSTDAGEGGEVLFELSPGILQSLSGRKSLVAMTLRSSTEEPTQIYVKCQLAGDGNCGRHRFDVNYEAGDVVFSIDLSNQAAAGGPGYLALNSDVTGAGHGVDVYAIRMRPQ